MPKQSVLLNYNETTVVTHTVIFNNTLKKGSVTIKKVNPEGEPMEGIELSIYKSDDTFVNKGKTGSDGVLSFKDLDQGDYYMVETKTEEAPVDSAALAQSEADKKAAEEAAKAEAAKQPADASSSAKSSIMENPWEFLIVSAAFVASVLVIIFTGD